MVKYACCLMAVDPIFRFLRRKLSILLAFFTYVVDVNVPFQVVGYGHSKVLCRRYSGQCVTV